MGPVMDVWHSILEGNRERVKHGMWIGCFTNEPSNPMVVSENETFFDPHASREPNPFSMRSASLKPPKETNVTLLGYGHVV